MKTIQEILSFRPQTAPVEHGQEPAIYEMVYSYYRSSGMSFEEAEKSTRDYVKALVRYSESVD
jgi:hypothetical protein